MKSENQPSLNTPIKSNNVELTEIRDEEAAAEARLLSFEVQLEDTEPLSHKFSILKLNAIKNDL